MIILKIDPLTLNQFSKGFFIVLLDFYPLLKIRVLAHLSRIFNFSPPTLSNFGPNLLKKSQHV